MTGIQGFGEQAVWQSTFGSAETRIQAYKREGWNIDVLCIDEANPIGTYKFENVNEIYNFL